jgi:SAM-dependent methyltransferase
VDISRADSYRTDLATVHHRGFGFHAAACAPGLLAFLEPVRERHGLVLEFGCGSGLLTRELIAAGHRVIATDASPAMLEIARAEIGAKAEEVRKLTLPDDPFPAGGSGGPRLPARHPAQHERNHEKAVTAPA